MSYLDRIKECSSYDPSRYLAFRVGAARVGEVRREFARRLKSFTEVFDVGAEGVVMKPNLADFDRRSAAMEKVLRTLAAEGVVTGWRDECYSVKTAHDAAPLLKYGARCRDVGQGRRWGVRGPDPHLVMRRRQFPVMAASRSSDSVVVR